MTPQDVARKLTPTEFNALCAKVATMFDILSVVRRAKQVTVQVKTDKGSIQKVRL